MSDNPGARELRRLLSSFGRRRPMRAGSLIVTLYGDAIVPRGGSLWLGALLDTMQGFGIEPGLVRTALSRLVAGGWFDRTRMGKRSYYQLSGQSTAEFAMATARIYRGDEPVWSGDVDLAIIVTPDSGRRAVLRDRMLKQNYGQAAPNVMLRPRIVGIPDHPSLPSAVGEIVRMSARFDAVSGEAGSLAGACWPLDDLSAAYSRFVSSFAPIAVELDRGARLSELQAFQLRILLVHDWRRIVLRDPLLPREMLPSDWPGTRARQLVAGLYRTVLAPSERWLDRHAVDENGALPPPTPDLARRFART